MNEKDRHRTAMQAPIAAPVYRVHYLKDRRERVSARFYSEKIALEALKKMQQKYGEKNASIVWN